MISSSELKLDYNLPYTAFLNQLYYMDEKLLKSERNIPAKSEYFSYIPIHQRELIKVLTGLSSLRSNGIFLDVGCGTGKVLALARYILGCKVKGVEIIESIAKAGMSAYDVPISIGDAFDLITGDFLKNVEVIYTYMPIADYRLMLKLHLHLLDTSRAAKIYPTRIEMLTRYLGIPGPMIVDL